MSVEEKVKSIIVEQLGVDANEVTPEASFVDDLGADTVLWELDYPHPDTVWPYTQQVAEEVFAASGLSQDTIELVTHRNSEKLFRWEPATI